MKRIFNHSVSMSWFLFVEVIVVLAVIISLSRLILPFANEFKAPFADEIGQLIGHPVEIGLLQATWNGIKPVIKLHNVVIRDKETSAELATFNHVYLKISTWQSLKQGRMVPEKLVLKDSWLQFLRHEDGRISILGVDPADHRKRQARPLEFDGPGSFYLENVRANLRDEKTETTHSLLLDFAKVAVDSRSIDLDANITLSDHSDETLHVILKSRGALSKPLAARTEFYIEGQQLDTSILSEWAHPEWPQLVRGQLNTQLWGRWHPSAGLSLTGHTRLDDVELIASGDQGVIWPIKSLSTYFRFSANAEQWQLDTENMKVSTTEGDWPVSGFSVAKDSNASKQRWRIKGDYLDMSALIDAVAMLSPAKTGVLSQLIESEFDASLEHYDFDLNKSAAAWDIQGARGKIVDASWQSTERSPGLSQLDVGFSFSEGVGKAQVSSKNALFDYPRIFSESIQAEELSAAISWDQSHDRSIVTIEEFRLGNADLSSQGAAVLTLNNGGRWLDLEMQIPHLEAAKTRDYVPYGIVKSDKMKTWLREAFRAGTARNIRFHYKGQLIKHAIKNSDAKIYASFDLEEGQLHYRNDWPDATQLDGHVVFDHTHLMADIESGQFMDAQISAADVDIADLFKSKLKLNASANGPFPTVFEFLRKSPLLPAQDELLAKVDASGDVDINLALTLPLSKKFKSRKPLINVDVGFNHNDIALRNAVSFSDLRGNLRLDNTNFSSETLKANFRGGELLGAVKTTVDGTTEIDVGGVFEADQLLPQLAPQIAAFTKGSSYWHGQLTLASPDEFGKRQLSLSATSKLEGNDITLPAPLQKAVGEEAQIDVNYRFGQAPFVSVNFDDAVSFNAVFDMKQGFRLQQASLGLGSEVIDLPSAGLRVGGYWPHLQVTPWKSAIDDLIALGKGGSGLDFDVISTQFGTLDVAGLRLRKPSVYATKGTEFWQLTLDSEQVSGQIALPHKHPEAPIKLQLSKLFLDQNPPSSETNVAEETPEYPSVELSAEQFKLGQRAFGGLTLKTRKTSTGLSIDQLKLLGKNYELDAVGAWQQKKNLMQLEFSMQAADIGKALQETSFGDTFGSGESLANGMLKWSGAPTSVDWKSLDGDIHLEVQNGNFPEVDPGLGRLVGLLNIDSLPRRLALDFRDFSDDGFLYDSLVGSGKISAGVLHTKNLVINSPSASIEIYGNTSLLTQQHQLKLDVTPKLKSTVPIAASVIAGPQTGAVVYLVDKLAESIGVDLNRTAMMRYSVSGSWQSPQIDALSSLSLVP